MSAKFLHNRTPIFESTALSNKVGKPVFLKMECYQPTGSFKIRGIGRLCQQLIQEGKTHLVASSGGNAGYSVAWIGKRLGIDVTVFVPESSSTIYVDAIKSEGATINVVGGVWEEADEAAKGYAKRINGGFVPPFDHPAIWAGHSTLIDEAVEQCEKPGAIVVGVGGGGLSCGILQGLYRQGWGDVPLITVEPEGAASFLASLKAQKLVTLLDINTIAVTLSAKRVACELFDWTRRHCFIPITVSDEEALQACRRFVDDHRVLVEPACGVVLAPIYENAPELKHAHSLLVIVCGGIGISLDGLMQYRVI